ncbi:MAG: EAL domain-containing protein [Acetobacteraceae bacterium]|nr:EAL domain-containing protein [Acetobacteraceae bacterium]
MSDPASPAEPAVTLHAARRVRAAMQRSYAIAVIATLLFGTGGAVTTLLALQDRDRRGEVAEQASLLRAKVQRVALLATTLVTAAGEVNLEDVRLDLRAEALALASLHRRLTAFEAGSDRPPPAGATEALRRHYFDGPRPLDGELRRFTGQALWIAENPQREGAFEAMWMMRLAVTGTLNEKLNQASDLFEDAARQSAASLRDLAFAQLALLLGGAALHLAFVYRPLAQRVFGMARRLEREARTDPLTGLANRRALLDGLARPRDGQPASIALVVLDVARLRDINESEGQAAGDAALREVAARVAAASQGLAAGDAAPVVGRISGDDFAVVLPGIADDEALERAAARIHAAATLAPVELGTRSIHLRASVGATRALGADPAETLRAADLVLREASRDPIHPIRVFRAEEDLSRLATRRTVLALLASDELSGVHAVLQPQLAAGDLSVAGFEALMRWRHPEAGVLAPPQFLALAAESGRLPALGRAARRAALHTFVELRREGLPTPRLALNLSSGELAAPATLTQIEADLAAASLTPADIEIEITEEVVADGLSAEVTRHLARLQAQGMALALDDFGTGAASLSQLLRLPVQVIKVDRSFISGVGHDRRAEQLVAATVRFAQAIGARTVAEGVETDEQLAFLRDAGCEVVQGYLTGRPMEPSALKAWLRGRTATTVAA